MHHHHDIHCDMKAGVQGQLDHSLGHSMWGHAYMLGCAYVLAHVYLLQTCILAVDMWVYVCVIVCSLVQV